MLEIKTTIWRTTKERLSVLVAEKRGLPSPIPKTGQPVATSDFGNTICTGVTTSGSGNNEIVVEIKLTIE